MYVIVRTEVVFIYVNLHNIITFNKCIPIFHYFVLYRSYNEVH